MSLAIFATGAPQSPDPHDHHLRVPVVVDGSKNPEKVPDKVAYRQFIQSASHHRNPTTTEKIRKAALLKDIGFSDVDEKAFFGALDGVREQLDSLSWTETAPLQDAPVRQATHNQIIDAALYRVRSGLTTEGMTKIAKYVATQVKTHIVIYGAIPQ